MSETKEVAIQNHGPLTGWTPQKLDLLKNTVCKDATDDEFEVFGYAVKRTGLDPFMKQIYLVKRKGVMTVQVGIDGYRLIADRTGLYAGNDDTVFDNEKNPTKASVTVYKFVKGVRCPFTASARWSEYVPEGNMAFMWRKMPCVMLGKVAEALALRKAFPAELSGTYVEEEMAQASKEEHKQEEPKQPEQPKVVIAPVTPKSADAVEWKPISNTTANQIDHRVALYVRIKSARELLGQTAEDLQPLSMRLFGNGNIKQIPLDQLEALAKELELRTEEGRPVK